MLTKVIGPEELLCSVALAVFVITVEMFYEGFIDALALKLLPTVTTDAEIIVYPYDGVLWACNRGTRPAVSV